jgi:hypothetical protein
VGAEHVNQEGVMSRAAAEYVEVGASDRVVAVPLGHLSIELGHLYKEDFQAGRQRLIELFRQVGPWADAARQAAERSVRPRTPRVSTCFLIDDYFGNPGRPDEVLAQLMEAATVTGLAIDYIVRESACAAADGVDLAGLVQGRLVADPPPGTTGVRPPLSVSGWLCNGERSPSPVGGQAMRNTGWQPPSENAANRHSIFLDIQLWDEVDGRRRWSCPYLAAVWQLLRLGLLRFEGRPVAEPRALEGQPPQSWQELPAVIRVNQRAAPFTAYRTFSILGGRFLPIEHAVRTILSQYAAQAAVAAQVAERAEREGIVLPASIVDRIGYVLGTP